MHNEIVIKPKKGFVSIDLKELWAYRELFYFLAWRDIKLRYKQTVLGVGWAVLQPFLTMVVFSVFFGRMADIPSDNIPYPIFSFAGLLFWGIFSNSLNNASQSLVGSANIIQKVYLPRIILPISSMVVTLVDFLFSFVIFLLIMLYYNFLPHLFGFLFLIPLVLIAVIASSGLGLFLAALNVKYRDVRYALPFFIQLLLFITPVIYPVSIIPKSYQWLLALNPMTGVIETFKSVFLTGTSVDWTILLVSIVSAIIFLLFGLWYFTNTERYFADII